MSVIKLTFLVKRNSNQFGFSYVEILLSVILISVLLVPAMQSLNNAIVSNTSKLMDRQLSLRNKMEEVLSKTYGSLYAETLEVGGNTTASISNSFSDLSGTADRRLVTIYRYNNESNSLSASDTGLLFVRVYYESDGSAYALNSLVARWW